MAGTRRNIAVAEQRALVDVGIELGLRRRIVEIVRPAHEIRHRARRPIAVEHLDHETVVRDVLATSASASAAGRVSRQRGA